MSRWIKFLLAIALGLAVGLVYGWVISPVEYLDTTPDTLRYDYRADYVLMVAETYNQNPDADRAVRLLAQLGSEPPVEIAIQALAYASSIGYPPADLSLIQNLAAGLQSWQPAGGSNQP